VKRLVLFLALLVPATAAADRVVLEKVTLQPKEKKEVSVESATKVKFGWDHTDPNASAKCEHNCVNMIRADGVEMASMLGGSLGVIPIDGVASVTFENVEDFAIEIEIFQK